MNQHISTGYQSINEINVYYEFYPNPASEKTIVLLHGFLSSTFTFRHLIPLLHQNFQILTIDLPPFGKSEKSSRFIYSYKNMAQTVIKLIDLFKLKNIALIGHSMGGQIVLNILHLIPQISDKAILLCSSSYLKRAARPLIFTSYLPFFPLFVRYWLERTGVKRNLQESLFNHDLINEEMIRGYLEPFLSKEIFTALTRMIRHREGDLPAEKLKQIKTPCLLIWGEQDKSVPLEIGERLKSDLTNAELVVLKNTGHAIPEERPKEIYHCINRFLRS
ncbi:alpha/beta fold hydrolase [Bacillota bacterium Lsc_1132]